VTDAAVVELLEAFCRRLKLKRAPGLHVTPDGFIAGKVINTATGEPVFVSEGGQPIMLGLFGPSQPAGQTISPMRLAEVDATGRRPARSPVQLSLTA
jgi:hypothetical protein